jgi:hypothetical protein
MRSALSLFIFLAAVGIVVGAIVGFYGAIIYGIVTVAKWAWMA